MYLKKGNFKLSTNQYYEIVHLIVMGCELICFINNKQRLQRVDSVSDEGNLFKLRGLTSLFFFNHTK